MHDHTLFQAICRTNRFDGSDKDYGYIVDFKELFEDVQNSIAVYSSDELDIDTDGCDGNIIVKNWLKEGKERLDAAREALRYLCEPVPQPREVEQFIHYFCGNANEPDALTIKEPLRISFYKAVVAYIRAYATIAQSLSDAGYTGKEISSLEREIKFYTEIREAIKKCSNEELDIKPYEADMRHLINTYIQADPATDLGNLSSLSVTELIIKTGIHDAIARNLNTKGKLSKNAIAEIIINNVRKTIIRDQLTDPKFYSEMSKLLDDLIKQKRNDTESYERFLKKAEALAKRLAKKQPDSGIPTMLHGNPEAVVLYNNLENVPSTTFKYPTADEERAKFALELDSVVREEAPAGWIGDDAREKQLLNALFKKMAKDKIATRHIFDIIKNQPGYK